MSTPLAIVVLILLFAFAVAAERTMHYFVEIFQETLKKTSVLFAVGSLMFCGAIFLFLNYWKEIFRLSWASLVFGVVFLYVAGEIFYVRTKIRGDSK